MIDLKKENDSWFNFLNQFFKDQIVLEDGQTPTKNNPLHVYEIFVFGVQISEKYGFLTLHFSDVEAKDNFLNIINLVKVVNSDFFIGESLPCRIYPKEKSEYKIVSFYDLREILSEESIIINRLIAFENIMKAIIRWNIQSINNI